MVLVFRSKRSLHRLEPTASGDNPATDGLRALHDWFAHVPERTQMHPPRPPFVRGGKEGAPSPAYEGGARGGSARVPNPTVRRSSPVPEARMPKRVYFQSR